LKFISDCSDATNVVVGENTRWQDPLKTATFLIESSDESFCQQLLKRTRSSDVSRELIVAYTKLDHIAAENIDSALRQQKVLIEGQLISKLVEKLPENSFIFSSNSTAVRQLDTFTVLNQYSSKSISLFCNRGASGIDGNLSTYLGIQADNKAATGIALLGDLAFFHDINGLALCAELNARRRKGTIIIINNGGGHIFNYLPQKNLNEFEKYWLTPVNMDLLHAAALFGLNYQKAGTIESLEQVLDRSLNCPGIDIVEVVIDQQASLRSSAEIRGRT
jgi:2-succinyl-5-enolpyruvyl-6-hydroxy-3-cyclohexene-1-carboxylate synthase